MYLRIAALQVCDVLHFSLEMLLYAWYHITSENWLAVPISKKTGSAAYSILNEHAQALSASHTLCALRRICCSLPTSIHMMQYAPLC